MPPLLQCFGVRRLLRFPTYLNIYILHRSLIEYRGTLIHVAVFVRNHAAVRGGGGGDIFQGADIYFMGGSDISMGDEICLGGVIIFRGE